MERGRPGFGGDVGTFSGARRWARDLAEGLEEAGRLRAREVLAKLSGGRGEGRCASLQTGGSKPGAWAGGGRVRASAPRAAVLRGAPRAFGGSVCKSQQAVKESSKGTQTYFCPGNPPLGEVPAGSWEWSVQVECWLDSASDVPLSPPRAIFTLHLEGVGVGGVGAPLSPSLLLPTYLLGSARESSRSLPLKGVGT